MVEIFNHSHFWTKKYLERSYLTPLENPFSAYLLTFRLHNKTSYSIGKSELFQEKQEFSAKHIFSITFQKKTKQNNKKLFSIKLPTLG